jgi:hypothetical protein
MDILCPKGHHSTDADYCSECGAKIQGAPSALSETQPLPPQSGAGCSNGAVCPDCGTPRANPTATFCEICRYNFVTQVSWSSSIPNAAPAVPFTPPDAVPADSVPLNGTVVPTLTPPLDVRNDVPVLVMDNVPLSSKWEAIVKVDASLYTEPDPSLPCPADEPERVYHLDFAENLIGRRNDRKDIHPEINLRDPGASHRHAKLLRQTDGSLVLLDVGSTNGTLLNGVDVPEGVKTALKDGDAITLGFWTCIVIRETRS